MMRRLLIVAVVGLLSMAAVPVSETGPATDTGALDVEEGDPPGEEYQWVQGQIRLPTRFIDGEGGWPGLGRRVYNGSAATNGTIAYIFDVWPETWGGAFLIQDVADATEAANVDVFFYEEFGDFGGQAAPTTTGEYATREPGGEFGFVPEGTRKAVVFTPDGLDTSFTYRGFLPPVISIAGDLDLTVSAGATVVWRNDTGDYSHVRHLPEDGERVEFDSSPEPNTGIPVGGEFRVTFTRAGTYAYETSTGTGTITVTDGPGAGTPAS